MLKALACSDFPPLTNFYAESLYSPMDIDNKDKRIIEILKQDSRAPIREIAKSTKIRPSTVHQRIQKLIDKKVIEKFTIKLNNKEVGENFIVFMLVKGGTTEYIDNRILNNSHVKEVFGITGEYDLLIKLKFEDVEEFHKFVLDFRREKKEIQSTLTMVVTTNLKEEI
ncbi:Lrp/AsnC family transcriptional regulator [Candidatus Woesearchaeota archaeon]|nr:Lrp/AsnC family transcriptional regulator [Candidatus Woesearchaeota archaeon]